MLYAATAELSRHAMIVGSAAAALRAAVLIVGSDIAALDAPHITTPIAALAVTA